MEKYVRKVAMFAWIMAAAAGAVGFAWRVMWARDIPLQIPLFYSKPWGEEQLASPDWMWIPIIITLVMAGLSQLAIARLYRYPVLQITVATSAIICQMILLAAVIRIIIIIL